MIHETENRSSSTSHFQQGYISVPERERLVRFLTVRALFGLLAFDVFGFGRNFAKMHRFVTGYEVIPHTAAAQTVERVCEAVNYACVWYPKRVLCLQRSALTTCLLRKYGVPAKMVIGAQTVPFKVTRMD